MTDTSDWPQRIAVYAFSIEGYDSLNERERQICDDAAEWARQRVLEVSGERVSVPTEKISAVMLKLRKLANFADEASDANLFEGLRDELAGWLSGSGPTETAEKK